MSGLPPNRPLNANDTDIDNYTAPPEGPFENVDYYQNVMTDYFETMGIPIVAGPRRSSRADAASTGLVAIVNETLVQHVLEGHEPDRTAAAAGCCGDQVPWFTVVGVAKDVKQGGVDQKTGTEFYFFVDQTAELPPPISSAPATMNVVLRTTLPPATLRTTIEARRARSRSRRAGRPAARDGRRVRRIDPASAPAGAAARRLRRPGAAARRDRHLRRAVLHGRRTPPRDRHPHGARRRSAAACWRRS